MTSQLESLKRQKEGFCARLPDTLKLKINDFLRVSLIKIFFTKLKKYDLCDASGQSQKAAAATTFNVCAALTDTAIRERTTSNNAAPAPKIDDAAPQSAAPATKNRDAN